MSSKTEPLTRAWIVLLAATILVAAALRLVGLQSGMWYDEIVTLVLSARHPIRQILTDFPGVNAHPLYSVLAHGSLQLFGESAWALRLPAAIFGVASVVMVYVLGARFLTRIEAWVAAAVMAVSYHHVWFSQNARGYTLIGFLTLVSTHYLLRAAETGRRRDYVIYALACALGIYTHLTMAFVVAGQALVIVGGHLVRWRPALTQPLAPAMVAWVGAGVVTAALYAPFVPGIIALMGLEKTQQAAGVATASWALSEAIRSLLSGTGVLAALVGGMIAVVGAWSVLWRWPLLTALLTAPAALTGLALVVLGQPLRPRFFFFLAGAAAIFVGRGIGVLVEMAVGRGARLDRRRVTTGVAVAGSALVLLSTSGLPTNYRVPKQDFDTAVADLDTAERAGAYITMAGPACLPIETYYEKASWPCLTTEEQWQALQARPGRTLVVHTLTDYVIDPALRRNLRDACTLVQRYPGTLGGGDLIVCEVPQQRAP